MPLAFAAPPTRSPGPGRAPRLPPAWRRRSVAVLRNGLLAGLAMAFTGFGVIAVGDPARQWWLPLLPAVLVVRPAWRWGRRLWHRVVRGRVVRSRAAGDRAAGDRGPRE